LQAVSRQLTHLGIVDWFDTLVTAEHTERHKPHPDVFLLAAERLGVQPDRCVVFEDSPLGFQAADAASMDWVDVRVR
jgi:HAD superfamily hydrolase (TIGR01509 family)